MSEDKPYRPKKNVKPVEQQQPRPQRAQAKVSYDEQSQIGQKRPADDQIDNVETGLRRSRKDRKRKKGDNQSAQAQEEEENPDQVFRKVISEQIETSSRGSGATHNFGGSKNKQRVQQWSYHDDDQEMSEASDGSDYEYPLTKRYGYVHLKTMNRSLNAVDSNDVLVDSVREVLVAGFKSLSREEIYEVQDTWVDNELFPKFKELFKHSLQGDMTSTKILKAFPAVDVINQAIFVHLDDADLVFEASVYFNFLFEYFNEKSIPDFNELTRLTSHEVVVLPGFVNFCAEFAAFYWYKHGKNVSWLFLTYAAFGGAMGEVVQKIFKGNNRIWDQPNYTDIDICKKPSHLKANRSIEAVISWVIRRAYAGLDAEAIRMMMKRTPAFMHSKVFAMMCRAGAADQRNATKLLTGFCECSNDVTETLELLLTHLNLKQWFGFQLERIMPGPWDNKISIQQFEDLVKSLAAYEETQAAAFITSCQGSLTKALENIQSALRSRVSVNVNKFRVDQAVNELFKKESDEFRQNQRVFDTIADEEAAKKVTAFTKHDMQVNICASLHANPNKWLLAQVPSGMGKTFIIMMLIRHYKTQGFTVNVFTCSKFLKKQMKSEISKHLDDIDFQITYGRIDEVPDGKFVAILDECDLVVETNSVIFDNHGVLAGLYLLNNAERVIMLTATVPEFLLQIKPCFDCVKPDLYFTRFPSFGELLGEGQEAVHILARPVKKKGDMLNQLLEEINSQVRAGKPVMVFVDKKDKAIEFELERLYGKKPGFISIANDEDALNLKNQGINRTEGVFLIDRAYARGFDPKLATDAFVCVAAFDKGFSYSEVCQAIGRGVRDQGQARGAYFCYKLLDTTPIVQHLKSNDVQYRDAAVIMERFWRFYPDMSFEEKEILSTFMDHSGIKVKLASIERKEPKVFLLLDQGTQVIPEELIEDKKADEKKEEQKE